jgi:hypothetical protein
VLWQRLTVLITLGLALLAQAASPEVIKVLPQFLDLKGRSSLSPSLLDRDAYQVELRGSPAKRSGLRFNVQWKAPKPETLTLRVEARGAHSPEPVTLEQTVEPGVFNQWTALTLEGEKYKKFGELISWRALLLKGTNVVAEQKSFLW